MYRHLGLNSLPNRADALPSVPAFSVGLLVGALLVLALVPPPPAISPAASASMRASSAAAASVGVDGNGWACSTGTRMISSYGR